MTYAILFKAHSWDEFVRRRLEAVLKRAGAAEVFFFVDQTKGFIGGIDYPNTIHASEPECLGMGLALYPAGKLFWYCNDYPLYYFYRRHPNFDYVLMIEYDAVAGLDLEVFITRAHESGVDAIAHPLNTPIAEWQWTPTAEGVYPPEVQLQNYLFSLALFSRRAVEFLYERRRYLSEEYSAGRVPNVPFGELFMATELMNNGFSMRKLEEFGDTSHFSWWPPLRESNMPLERGTFFHPVLDDTRYVESVLRYEKDLAAWFDRSSLLQLRLQSCPPELVIPQAFRELRKRRQPELYERLTQTIEVAELSRLRPTRNVALHRRATQSSISLWSRGANVHSDAAGGVDGVINGNYGFHTEYEQNPWWMVDLEEPHDLSEIRLFNRLDVRHRTRTLVILHSLTGTQWSFAHVHTEADDFGGADGNPLIVKFNPAIRARFVRIELPARTVLHLDEVEIFGEEAPPSAP